MKDKLTAADMLGLSLERRRPSTAEERMAAPPGDRSMEMIGGLLVDPSERYDNAAVEDDLELRGVMAIRRAALRHPCTRKQLIDPPCTHPRHDIDVLWMREMLAELGLPGDIVTLVRALAYEAGSVTAGENADDHSDRGAGRSGQEHPGGVPEGPVPEVVHGEA